MGGAPGARGPGVAQSRVTRSTGWRVCRLVSCLQTSLGSVSVSSGGGASSRILNEALVQRARASEKLHGDRLRPDGPPASPPSLRVPSAEGLGSDGRRPSGGSGTAHRRGHAAAAAETGRGPDARRPGCCGQGLVWLRPCERRPPSPPGRARLPGPPGSVRPRRGDAV